MQQKRGFDARRSRYGNATERQATLSVAQGPIEVYPRYPCTHVLAQLVVPVALAWEWFPPCLRGVCLSGKIPVESPSKDLDSVAAPYLFIAHDNPQLGSSVATILRGNGKPGMSFMLESKDESGLTVFVIGTIAYSGPFEGIEYACIDAGDMARGSLCLVGTDLMGYKANLKTVTTRPRGELIEIDLAPEKKDKSDNGRSSSARVMAEGALTKLPLTTRENLKSLMRTCKSRVDVILDPYHTDNKWYPLLGG